MALKSIWLFAFSLSIYRTMEYYATLFPCISVSRFICQDHPEPVTNDDEFELLLSRSKFFKFILVGFVLQFLQTSEIFTFLQKKSGKK